jgi:serine/threonine protein kinase
LQSTLIRQHDWEELDNQQRSALIAERDEPVLLNLLVSRNLMTSYQVERIQAGRQFGLVLGNYRVLEPLGRGAMGQVYKCEHVRLPRQVAIKVQVMSKEVDRELARRFENEAWMIGQLHPWIEP